jgi:hypothetical protein
MEPGNLRVVLPQQVVQAEDVIRLRFATPYYYNGILPINAPAWTIPAMNYLEISIHLKIQEEFAQNAVLL